LSFLNGEIPSPASSGSTPFASGVSAGDTSPTVSLPLGGWLDELGDLRGEMELLFGECDFIGETEISSVSV